MTSTLKLSDILLLKGKQHIIIGSSGSGKTYFTKSLLELIKSPKTIIIFGKDEKEWVQYMTQSEKKIKFIHEDPFASDYIFSLQDVIIVFDDYSQEKKSEQQFYKFVNYHIRHNDICFFLITHSIFKSNLYSKIVSAPSLFLTSCSANTFLVQKYDKMYRTNITKILRENIVDVNDTYRPIIYITPKYIINSFEQLVNPSTHQEKVIMFKQDKTYYLLSTDNFEFETKTDECTNTKLDEILIDFEDMYPTKFKKIKKFITNLYTFLDEKNLVNNTTLDINIKKVPSINFYDFIISSQDFSKKPTNKKIKPVLQYLKDNNFKTPRFTIQNPQFRTFLS